MGNADILRRNIERLYGEADDLECQIADLEFERDQALSEADAMERELAEEADDVEDSE